MKTNTLYKLNKNLDLKNENFLIKKGTLVTVSKRYNETDETIPTVVSLKFNNIIGEYQFDEADLKIHQENKVFKIQSTPLFSNGNCVVDTEGNNAVIDRVIEFDPASDQWLYSVNYNGIMKARLENQLKSC